MKVNVLDSIPLGLLKLEATELEDALGGPTLIRIPGRQDPPIFVSVLLHGDETSGWDGMRMLLEKHPVPARSLIWLIGNVSAAAEKVRKLPHQQDYNRIWPDITGIEGEISASVHNELHGNPLHAVVDLHNNTGWNPPYSLVTRLDSAFLGLAGLFSPRSVFITDPLPTLTRAYELLCPTITLELGRVGDPVCAERAFTYMERLMTLSELPDPDWNQLTLYNSLGRVEITKSVEFSFQEEQLDTPLVLSGEESWNFQGLEEDSLFALSEEDDAIRVINSQHRNVTSQYFRRIGNQVTTRRHLVPAMYTKSKPAIRQDCLCYLMEPMTRSSAIPG